MNLELKRLNRIKWRSSEGKRRKRKWVLLWGSILIGGFLLIYFFVLPSKSLSPPTLPTESILPIPKEPQLQVIEGDVKEKSTLFKSLSEKNVPLRWIDLVISKLKTYVNFKKIKGGTYRLFTDAKGELVKFIYEAGPTEIYEVEKDPQGYTAQRKKVSMETHLVKVVGEIRSSLFEAMDGVGEKDPLTMVFAEILAWEIDFYKDVREGDRFKVVVEKIYKGDQFIQYGAIHAVEYQRGLKVIRGIRYKGDYYNDKGISLKRAFLKVPLRFNRISSKFSLARRHPILGGVLPHFGVDYAAPPGTAVWAVGDGTVISCGWNGGFGKQVILRHMNGYTTYYGHLSGYGPGIRNNKVVKQKQIIGFVGSTGLSTGPHLDYRIAKDGRFRNPLKETFPTGLPIGKKEMETFQKRKDEMIVWLQGEAPYQKRIEETGRIP
jgi:murein DD-endopeptidase MepM/ murein hydrolase activator NlpD